MASSESSQAAADDLDQLLRRFVDSGYVPEGLDLDEAAAEPHAAHPHDHGAAASVREFEHRGHRVRIVTRYDVTIDGDPWEQPMHVGTDGSVMYHGLPQYVVSSAVDLVRAVIDTSYEAPDEIRAAFQSVDEA